MLVLLALVLAQVPPAVDPARVAPGLAEFRTELETTRTLVARSQAIGRAIQRIHNRWGERLATGPRTCTDPEAMSLAARTEPFGAAYRDDVQSARAASARLARLLESPTLTPLLSLADRRQAEASIQATRDHARIYTELSAWQARFVEPYLRRCRPALTVAPGLSAEPIRALDEPTVQVAIVAVGDGVICPDAQAAGGRVVVLTGDAACVGAADAACGCTPERVSPGAVLGP